MKTQEGRLKDLIKRDLKARNAYFFMPVQVGYGQTTLDILACLQSRFLGIETKAPGKEPTPRQYVTMEQIKQAGGAAFWCDSWEMYELMMQELGFNDSQSSAIPDLTDRPSPRVEGLPRSG